MLKSNLSFNLLTFSHAKTQLTFHFTTNRSKGLFRAHHTVVPKEVIDYFGWQEHFYTSFDSPFEESLSVTKDSSPTFQTVINDDGDPMKRMIPNCCFSRALLKLYYTIQIGRYFKSQGAIINQSFVNDAEVWIPHSEKTSDEYDYYEKYQLRVQFSTVTDKPELLLIYCTSPKVFRQSVLDLSQQGIDAFNWVIHENNLFHYKSRPDYINRVLNKVYPVWNFELREQLNQKTQRPERGNKYIKTEKHLKSFIENYLNTEDFLSIIPLDSFDFFSVPDSTIGEVDESAKTLLFGGEDGNQFKSNLPKLGIQQAGPFKVDLPKVQFFFILHKDDLDLAKKLNNYLTGIKAPKGIYDYINVPFSTKPGFSIAFSNKFNPIPEIEAKITQKKKEGMFQSDTHYLPLYISPFNKNVKNPKCKRVYFHVKEYLLKKGFSSQVADAYKLRTNEKYYLYILNLSVAMLSKLGGIPWQIDTKLKNELVIGVGAFKHRDTNTQYIGSAISFTNTGQFNKFKCFRSKQTTQLAGSIIDAVMDYTSLNPNLKRLVIHFYKNMSRKELAPIEEALRKLNFDIPVVIVTVHKTESSDLVAFDHSWEHLMPKSGTFINIRKNNYLLFNNSRYEEVEDFDEFEGYPFPIKVKLSCNKPEHIESFVTKRELIQQVYQFSRLYWKSVRQQNLPVTIKYPEMVAEMFPYFQGNEIPPYGVDKLWFL